MLSTISSYQLSEWMAFFNLEPFGFESQMFGHGIVASTLVNIRRKKGTKATVPQDFIPKIKEKKTAREFFQNLKSMILSNSKDK